MNKKLMIVLIIIIGISALLLAIYYIYTANNLTGNLPGRDKGAVVKDIKQFQSGEAASASQPPIKRVVAVPGREKSGGESGVENEVKSSGRVTKSDLSRMASSFAERFGSYSNQSNFGNITDLKIFMSGRMREWANKYIGERQAERSSSSIYYGITTKAVASEAKDYDDDAGKAVILVKTRRQEATASINNIAHAFSQDILISLVKEDGAWKVDSASWQ